MIYLDNAATTSISDEVLSVMMPYLTQNYGNASSLYSFGSTHRCAIDTARRQVADAINASPSEIFFTSCGSESDNWALRGLVSDKKHIVTTQFEHPAIFNTCKELENNGHTVTYIKPNRNGYISPIDVENAICDDTKIVSIMSVNNELGTIQPISEIGKICKKYGVVFHTDAVQAIGHIAIDVKAMNIDMLSLSGHKFHAPKGIGVLYVRNDIKMKPLIYGGGQEFGLRAGTENVASIVGLGKAIEIATASLNKQEDIARLRNILAERLLSIGGVTINGGNNCIAGTLSVSVEGCESEAMMLWLDMKGICVSAGSACCSGSLEPSRTLKTIGLDNIRAYNTIRISMGEDITEEQIENIYNIFKDVVERLRKIILLK